MWFLLLLIYVALSEPVILKGENQLILRGGSHPCEGHVAIYHENIWGYVGDKDWNAVIEEVACRSAHCGSPVGPTEDVERPINSKVWLNELKCNGSENYLWECGCPGWGISVYRKDTVKKIKCSNKITISLDEFNTTKICAGAVKWSTNGTTGYFCSGAWERRDADHLCQSLQCGKSRELSMDDWGVWKGFEGSKKMTINCSNIESINSLWHCLTEETTKCTSPVSVVCTDYKKLQLNGDASNVCSGKLETLKNNKWTYLKNKTKAAFWCTQMHCGNSGKFDVNKNLICSDNVTVLLRDGSKPSKCYGEVHVNVNNNIRPVCGSKWTREEAKVVCKELKCGKVVSHSLRNTQTGVMDNVNCLGSESSLWHCQARHDPSQCSSMAYVICSDSVNVTLKDGPGKCAGRLEILYQGMWRQVDKDKWNNTNSDTVCKQMDCGSKGKVSFGEFIKGSDNFLTENLNCQPNAKTISECITDDPNRNPNPNTNNPQVKQTVEITCEEHKMVFLEGNNSCSGMVGISYKDNTYWLSGSNMTWNNHSANTVCREMHCGNALSIDISIQTVDKEANIWNGSYNCSPNTKSLFDCAPGESPTQNDTIATVTCSGSITLNLTNKCWGHVVIDVEGRRGGVCGDSWTLQHSEMLCKSIGCGTLVQKQESQSGESSVLVKSLHSAKKITRLVQSNFVLNEENNNVCKQNQVYVVCTGSVKSRLSLSRDKCSGNVDIWFEGQWLPVCTNALQNKTTEIETICKDLDCGQAVQIIEHFGPKPKEDGNMISEIQCPEEGTKSLRDCKLTLGSKCIPTGLKCSKWGKMRISNTCSGSVSVYSNGKHNAVSNEGWGEVEANQLCQDLNCGSSVSTNSSHGSKTFSNSTFSCPAGRKPNKIWDCEKENSALLKEKKQLTIKCQAELSVTLMKGCHGELKLDQTEVCSRHWNKSYSHLVCQELGCSNAVVATHTKRSQPKLLYHHVRCDDNNFKLSQCQTVTGKCDGTLVSVYCVANVKFRTTGKCGGQIEVDYGTGWNKICPVTLSTDFQKKICQELAKESGGTECGDPKVEKISEPAYNKEEKVVNVSLKCTTNHMDLKHCVVAETCENVKPAQIYCEGYTYTTKVNGQRKQFPTVAVLLGMGLFFLLVIMTTVLVRIYIIKKDKNTQARMLSRNEVEFESGDYEDVTSKENEMEDFSRGRFKSDGEVNTDNDARSASSLPYDDIDEAPEAQPLTTASRDSFVKGETPDQTGDGVTYEVDDLQESYDDIEASPEITQTKAEVHDSPTTTPESNTVVLPLLGQGDGDYLDPDQDG